MALAVLLAATTPLSGCLSKLRVEYDGGPPWPRGASAVPALHAYDYRPAPIEPTLEPLRARRGAPYRVFQLRLASAGDNGQTGRLFTARYYQSTGRGRKGLVVILPIWGSSTYPPRAALRELMKGPARGDLHYLLVQGERPLFDWGALRSAPDEEAFLRLIEQSRRRIETTVLDLRRVLDWTATRPEIDTRRVGIAGFSIGAIVGSLAMGVDTRFAAGVFVMGGGNLHEIFAACPGVGPVRRPVLKRFGWTRATFQHKLAAPLDPVNPVRFAGRLDPRRVLIVDAKQDRCIPEGARSDLWNALGRPERISILAGHKFSFLSMTVLDLNSTTREIARFLDRRLAAPPPAEPQLISAAAQAGG